MAVKRTIREPEEPAPEPESVPVHTTPPPAEPKRLADNDLGEYEVDGATFMLSAAEAQKRGAKAVSRPANKAVTPQNK